MTLKNTPKEAKLHGRQCPIDAFFCESFQGFHSTRPKRDGYGCLPSARTGNLYVPPAKATRPFPAKREYDTKSRRKRQAVCSSTLTPIFSGKLIPKARQTPVNIGSKYFPGIRKRTEAFF